MPIVPEPTRMIPSELMSAAFDGTKDEVIVASGSQLLAIANAALRHAIDEGQVVAPDDLHILKMKAANCDEWIEKTNWVQETSSSLPFHTAGMHRADAMKKAIEQLRAECKTANRDLGKAERLLERMGWRSDSGSTTGWSYGGCDWAPETASRQVANEERK